MPGTFTRLLYHIIFSTQRRANLIAAELQPRLNEYLGGTIRSERGISHEIDGVAGSCPSPDSVANRCGAVDAHAPAEGELLTLSSTRSFRRWARSPGRKGTRRSP